MNEYSREHLSRSSAACDIDNRGVAKRRRLDLGLERYDAVPWTSARCNRLLRTITSRLHILRKIANNGHHAERSSQSRTAEDSQHDIGYASIVQPYNITASSPRHGDPDWLPQDLKATSYRTYTKKHRPGNPDGRHGSGHASQNDGFRTPFVKKFLAPPIGSCSEGPDVTSPSDVRIEGRRHDRKRKGLPILPTTSAEKASRALLEAFDTLLSNTQSYERPSRIGTRSLLSTCLRKIPACIDLERALQSDADGAHGPDVAAETYEYLETLGGTSGAGYKGLREVVRAHAVHLIAGAIADGLLAGDAIDSLLETCRKREAVAEAQAILRCRLFANASNAASRLQQFVQGCQTFHSIGFMFQTLGEALQRGVVTSTQVSEHTILWRELVQASIVESRRAVAMLFLQEYAVARIRDARIVVSPMVKDISHRTIIYLMALIGVRRDQHSSDDMAQHIHRLALALSLALAESVDDEEHSTKVAKDAEMQFAAPFLMSSLILRLTGSKQPTGRVGCIDFDIIFREHDDAERHPRRDRAVCQAQSPMTELLCDIGRTMAHSDKIAAGKFVRCFVTNLVQMADEGTSSKATAMRKVAAESAMAWAEICNDKDSYMFAEEVEEVLSESQLLHSTDAPSERQQPLNYRWEEGLCEWIAKTPGEKRPRLQQELQDKSDGLHDSGIEMDDSPLFMEDNGQQAAATTTTQPLQVFMDDEDELALLTPPIPRQMSAENRCELDETSKAPCLYARRLPVRRVVVTDGDSSDDELGFA